MPLPACGVQARQQAERATVDLSAGRAQLDSELQQVGQKSARRLRYAVQGMFALSWLAVLTNVRVDHCCQVAAPIQCCLASLAVILPWQR